MKLYVKHDLERAARLAVLYHVKGDDPEAAIASATKLVSEDGLPYYDEKMVKQMLVWASALNIEDADRLLEEALDYVRR